MGDFIVLSVVALLVIAILYYLFKDKKKGVAALCKSCATSLANKKEEMPAWVQEYKVKQDDSHR
ncbi:MAG: FeoB-associated Cys-rich membrane protein [Erysipelothrix sp.]|jgi:hypothetical protein|nr:FeoB-associated Cys-rich membrane protein [Erysipelothrix sp.]